MRRRWVLFRRVYHCCAQSKGLDIEGDDDSKLGRQVSDRTRLVGAIA
jgi:hypothetical protein